jgi:hypothetical protein
MYLNLIVIKLVTNVSMKGRLHHITNVAVAFFVRIIILLSFAPSSTNRQGRRGFTCNYHLCHHVQLMFMVNMLTCRLQGAN